MWIGFKNFSKVPSIWWSLSVWHWACMSIISEVAKFCCCCWHFLLTTNIVSKQKYFTSKPQKKKQKKIERWRRGVEEEEDRVRGSTNDLENCNRLLNFLPSLSQAAAIFLLLLLLMMIGLLYYCNKSQSSVCLHCFKMKGVGWDGSDKKHLIFYSLQS
jgi:hypothetical protein